MTEQEGYTFKQQVADRVTLFWNFIERIRHPLPEMIWIHDGMVGTYFRSYSAIEADQRLVHYKYEKAMGPWRRKWEAEESMYFLGPCGQHDRLFL